MRRLTGTSIAVLAVAILCLALTTATATAYDELPGVPLAGDVPYDSASVFDTTVGFNNALFGEHASELSSFTVYLGCNAWGARTAWLRFTTRVSGNVRVTIESGYDVFYKVYGAATTNATVSDLDEVDCQNSNEDASGEDYQHGYAISAGRTVYVQVLVTCADRINAEYCNGGEYATAVGGPTTVRLRFTPDNADGDTVPDTLDRCGGARGPGPLAGCPDNDGDGVADLDDPCPAAGAFRGCGDGDGDGVGDLDDVCPAVFGRASDGCRLADHDGDGHAAAVRGGRDCNDDDAKIRPGAIDVPRNGTDEDCDGSDKPYPRLTNDVAALSAWSPRQRRTVGFLAPFVVDGPLVAGMTVRLRCQGRGCPFSRRAVIVRKRKRKVRIGGELVGRRLAPGAKLTLAIARPGYVGKVMRYKIRRRGRAQVLKLCTEPGEARPRKQCD